MDCSEVAFESMPVMLANESNILLHSVIELIADWYENPNAVLISPFGGIASLCESGLMSYSDKMFL